MSFELFSKELQNLIREKGFIEPTLPQKIGIPEIMKGSNVLIIAPTGIGKTEASCLPIFDKIHINKSAPIATIYISPTRSLNRDLLDRLVWWAEHLNLEIAVRHGDTTQTERKAQVEVPPHVLITTPESLNAMLLGKRLREHLKNVKHVIIDEIHEIVGSKRGVQLSIALERLVEVSGEFQRIGLSATVGTPELVAEFLGKNVKIIRAEQVKNYNISIESPHPGKKDQLIADDLFIGIETVARLRRLYELITSHTSVIAFTNTRETAEVLSSRLRQLDKELKQEVHHGSLSKERRVKAEQKFKAQELKSLIATSSLELGIDIGSIDLVIQYLSPRQVARLIQRVGRAGHKVGEVSKGILLTGGEDIFESLIIADFAMKKKLEPVKIHESSFDVLTSQIMGLAMEYDDITEDKVYKIVKRAFPFRSLSKKELTNLLEFMQNLYLIWLNPTPLGYRLRKRRKAWTYYFENLSMIPDTVKYKVISIIEGEPIGSLDEEFVAEHGKPGDKFICSGRAWKVLSIDKRIVNVEPVSDIESTIPAWEGETIPVPFDIAQGVAKLRRFIASNLDKNPVDKLQEKYKIDKNSAEEMIETIMKHNKTHTLPDDKTWLIENHKDFIIVHACNGSLVNDTLGRYVAALLSAEIGIAVNVKIDPYRIMFQNVAVKPEAVKRILEDGEKLEAVLESAIVRSMLFKQRFFHIARRFGILSRQVDLARINMNKIIEQYRGTPAYAETMREIFHDKMNLNKTNEIFQEIKENKIKLVVEPGLSYIGEVGLVHRFSEIMKPAQPQDEIFRAFKRRLFATRMRLICMNCAEYTNIKPLKQIEEFPECPHCNSRLIAAVRKTNMEITAIVRKWKKKKKLDEEEEKILYRCRRSSDLIIVYGRKAVMAMACRGVGPETAARVLAYMHPTKEKLLKDLLEAEKQYAKTKPFWK